MDKLKSENNKLKEDKNLYERFESIVQIKTSLNNELKDTKNDLAESRKVNEKLANSLADKFDETKR